MHDHLKHESTKGLGRNGAGYDRPFDPRKQGTLFLLECGLAQFIQC